MKTRPRVDFVSSSADETIRFAKNFARRLKPGAVIALIGPLGSGKTTFIKGVAAGLGLKNVDDVKSPTFVLMHIYPTRTPLYHFDLYRLENEKEIETLDLDEYLGNSKAVSCVEWAEKAPGFIPQEAFRVRLAIEGENQRRIRMD